MKARTRRAAFALSTAACTLALIGCGAGGSGSDSVQLRLSHQWPAAAGGEDGDFRAELADQFAKEVDERTDGGVSVQVYPNGSLVGADEQYAALTSGAVDMSVFPLTYAAGKVPLFDITMMPGLVRNHEQANAWPDSEAGKRVEEIAEENGVKILTWVWNSGVFATKGDPIISPDDVRPGMVMRGAGPATEAVLEEAGAGITSMASSDIYSALQTGVLDGVTTSASSVISYSLAEQIDSYTAPTENTMWFVMQPLIISLDAWEKLGDEQQSTLEEIGEELQASTAEASLEGDRAASAELEDAGVEVVEMGDAAFEEWRKLSQETAWATFAEDSKEGQELLDLGQQVGDGK